MNADLRTLKLESIAPPEGYTFRPDSRDGYYYDFRPKLELAVKVALATGRPLLLRGEPGSGKSSFAPYVARNLGWRYYEVVVTARTEARDLMWSYDMVQRLNDAQGKSAADSDSGVKPDKHYIQPRALWWVFNRESARLRGAKDGSGIRQAVEPHFEVNGGRDPERAVLLIDEIDKGDPDVPNNLLVALGCQEFTVEETDTPVSRREVEGNARSPLIIVTTNQERALPQAFLRRCVIHELEEPDLDRLIRIGEKRFSDTPRDLIEKVATQTMNLRGGHGELFRKPSIAEYLDALQACVELGVGTEDSEWETIENVTLKKER